MALTAAHAENHLSLCARAHTHVDVRDLPLCFSGSNCGSMCFAEQIKSINSENKQDGWHVGERVIKVEHKFFC